MVSLDTRLYSLVVCGLTETRLFELQGLVTPDKGGGTINCIQQQTSRPIPQNVYKLNDNILRVDYASFMDFKQGLRLLRSRGFIIYPLIDLNNGIDATDQCATNEWTVLRLGRVLAPGYNIINLYSDVPGFTRPSLLIMSDQDTHSVLLHQPPDFTSLKVLEQKSTENLNNVLDALQNKYEVQSIDSMMGCLGRLSDLVGGVQRMSDLMSVALTVRDGIKDKNRPLLQYAIKDLVGVYKTNKRRESVLLNEKLVTEKVQRSLSLTKASGKVPSTLETSVIGGTENPSIKQDAVQLAATPPGIASSLLTDLATMLQGDAIRRSSTLGVPTPALWKEAHSSQAHSGRRLSRSALMRFCSERDFAVRKSMDVVGTLLPNALKEILGQILLLIDASPAGEVSFLDLQRLYNKSFNATFDPIKFNFPDLKSFVLNSTPLCLTWVYTGTFSKEAYELKNTSNFVDATMIQGETANKIVGGQQSALTGPIPISALRVQRRDLSVQSIALDVIVALVAHWVLMHEVKNGRVQGDQSTLSPALESTESRGTFESSIRSSTYRVPHISESGSSTTLSSIGMPLTLLSRTWENNWLEISTLDDILLRSGVNSLEKLVSQIPEFEIKLSARAPAPPATGLATIDESLATIYLKKGSRVPLVPELVPDPTLNTFNNPTRGNLPVIFFPPLFPLTASRRSSALDFQARGMPSLIKRLTIKEPHFTEREFAILNNGNCSSGIDMLSELTSLMYELISVCCEWQCIRWSHDEDIIEMKEEEELHGKDGHLHRSSTSSVSPHDGLVSPKFVSRKTTEETESSECEDGLSEADQRKLRKKKKRDSKLRRRTQFRELLQTPDLHDNVQELQSHDKEETINLSTILKSLGQDSNFLQKRQHYRNSNAGIFVSSIKLEWGKYFDNVYPLNYFMEKAQIRKVKTLLAEIPNLILTGDGGFMRVITTYHARQVANPFPPKGFGSSGTDVVESIFTPFSQSLKFQADFYVGATTPSDLENVKTKAQFFEKMYSRNSLKIKRNPQLDIMSSGKREQRRRSSTTSFRKRGPSVSDVWELPQNVAKTAFISLLCDLVVLQAIKQKQDFLSVKKESESADEMADKVLDGREIIHWDNISMTHEDINFIKLLQSNGVYGLMVQKIPTRWNCTFVKFSPFASFIKKAGFRSLTDPEFIQSIRQIKDKIFIGCDESKVPTLYPASLKLLEDSSYQRPEHMSAGVWLKRRSFSYLHPQFGKKSMSPLPGTHSLHAGRNERDNHHQLLQNSWRMARPIGKSFSPDDVSEINRRKTLATLDDVQKSQHTTLLVPSHDSQQRRVSDFPLDRFITQSHTDPQVLRAEMIRRLSSIEANISDQTAALQHLSRLLSSASRQSKRLSAGSVNEIKELMRVLGLPLPSLSTTEGPTKK